MIAAMVPPVGVVNSAPLVLTGDAIGPRLACCLLASLNSLALDFVARQKVNSLHLNFFIVNQLAILPPDCTAWTKRQTLEKWISDRVLKLTCTADDMRPLAEAAGLDPPIHKWKPTSAGSSAPSSTPRIFCSTELPATTSSTSSARSPPPARPTTKRRSMPMRVRSWRRTTGWVGWRDEGE